jgi:hypothetical protein
VSIDLPSAEHAATLADWTELLLASGNSDYISFSKLTRILRSDGTEAAAEEFDGDLDDDDRDDLELERDEDDDVEDDARVELLVDEVRTRRRIGENLYPFDIDDSDEAVVQRGAPGERVYFLLLILSADGTAFRADGRAHEVEATYDTVAMEAMRRYLGRNAKGVRFARNASDEGDAGSRPAGFPEAVDWLRGRLQVGRGSRAPGRGSGADPADTEADEPEFVTHWESETAVSLGREPLASYNDAGVDVVVWWHFADGRAGSPVLLAQCTVQRRWERKLRDIPTRLWERWVDFSAGPPQTALVIPFADRLDSRTWDDRTLEAGVIIDRRRLLELLAEVEPQKLASLVDEETATWVEREFDLLAG